MARTAAMRRQGLQRRSSRRHNLPKHAPAPSTGIPIIDIFAQPLGNIWNKLAQAGGMSPKRNVVDDDSTEPNSPYSSDASSSEESLLSTPATTPPASSSLGPDDFVSTSTVHSFSKAPGAFPASFDPTASPQKATRAPPNSPSKPTKTPSARPNRYGLFETESLYFSLPPNQAEPVEQDVPFAPPPPTARQLEETLIHDREHLELVLNAMLEDERTRISRAAKHHASNGVRRAKYTRDNRAWFEHDGEANARAEFRAKVQFGARILERERAKHPNRHGGGRVPKYMCKAEAKRHYEKEIQECLRAAERYNFNFIEAVGNSRKEKRLKEKLMKRQAAAAAAKQQEKARAPAPPPPPPSLEKKCAPAPAPTAEAVPPSTPKKNPMPDLAKFPCFVKPGMFDEPPMPPPQPSPQASPSRPKPFAFGKPTAQPSPSRPRTRPAAGPSTPRRPQPQPQFTKPAAEPAFATPSDEAEEERARQRQQQREQRYFGMEDVASFIRRRKWESPAGGNARGVFEDRPRPRPFSPQASPSKPQPAAGHDFPREYRDFPKMPRFNAAPKFTAPPPPPQAQPQAVPQPQQKFSCTPITEADFRAQERFETYDSLWASVLATTSSLMDIELSFSAFPWPLLASPKSLADIKQVDIEEFLFHRLRLPRTDADFATRRRQAVKDALLRWHPDKFSGRVMARVVEEDREKVKEAALVVGRILVGLVGK